MGCLEILAALGPAIMSTAICLVVTLWDPVKHRIQLYREVPELMERIREVMHDLSLLGSGAAAFFGYRDQDILLIAITFAWFFTFSHFADKAALRAVKLREVREAEATNNVAETMRSIAHDVVREERERGDKDI